MRVSLRWLEEFVDLPMLAPEELSAVFSSLGMPVEGIEEHDVAFRGVIVGKVESVVPHPDADRLRLCSVTLGDRVDEVVCGAWNFDAGVLVPVAVPGSTLADGTEVGIRTIRGVSSHGMICSERELGLGDDAEGILVLEGDFEVGDDFFTKLPFPDIVFDLEIEANRPDEMSILGVARELAAYFSTDYRIPEVVLFQDAPPQEVDIVVEDREGCGRFVAIPVEDVRITASPILMRMRLESAGVRPINNIVDITNHVMLELGQPMHAFDRDLIEGSLVVRKGRRDETLVTLDGVDRSIEPEDIVISDTGGAVSLAGIMGGSRTEVSASTRRVLLEAATWDPATITATSTRHGLRTEASARFSRGVDPNLPPLAARRAAQWVERLGAGSVSSTLFDHVTSPVTPWEVELPVGELRRLLGIEIGGAEAALFLNRLGISTEGQDPLKATVPTWRQDLRRSADLVEEVARLAGYDSFPETLPVGKGGGLTVTQHRTRHLRDLVTGAGFSETQSFSFSSVRWLDRLGIPTDDPRRSTVALLNPPSEEDEILRSTLLPALVTAAARNLSNGMAGVALFEIGRVFRSSPWELDDRLPAQPEMLGFVAAGNVGPRMLGATTGQADIHFATGLWRLIAEGMGIPDQTITAASVPGLHPGRSGRAMVAGVDVGYVGELHPAVARAFELPGRVAVGELELADLVRERQPWRFTDPSPFPPAIFDLAFEIEDAVPAGDLLREVRAAAGAIVESVHVFDEFKGDPVPPGAKSLAVRVTLRAPDRTLSTEEVGPIRKEIARSVVARFGGKLRGGLD